ncbi:hypothetical protein MMC30_008397 [Trapelia coarctata]|nr:hypothetical protein [Trapelia coarctata]
MDPALADVGNLAALNPALVQQQLLKVTQEHAPDLIESGQKYLQAVPPIELANNVKDELQGHYEAAIKSWEEFKKNALELKSQGHKVVKFEIDESVPLSKFFPDLPKEIFRGISFRKSAFEYRFEATEGKAAGAYLMTEVDLEGVLNEILEVFETLLEKVEPVLRLSAYVGAVFDNDDKLTFKSLTLTGLLVGCNIEYPRNLLTISQLGATLTIKKGTSENRADEGRGDDEKEDEKKKSADALNQVASALRSKAVEKLSLQDSEERDGSESETEPKAEVVSAKTDKNDSGVFQYFEYEIFGVATLAVTGPTPSLVLDVKMGVVNGTLNFNMSPVGEDKKWTSVFGVNNFDLTAVNFSASYPLKAGKENKDYETFIKLEAMFPNKFKDINITGHLTPEKDESYIEGTMNDVEWERLRELFEQIHQKLLETIDQDMAISSKQLKLVLNSTVLEFKGDLSVYSQKLADVSLKLGPEGFTLSSTVPKWKVDDNGIIVVDNATIALSVGCVGIVSKDPKKAVQSSTKTIGWFGNFTVKGDVTVRDKGPFHVELQIIRSSARKWGFILVGQAATNFSLHDIVEDIPNDGDFDLHLDEIALVASNIDVEPEDLPFSTHGFPVKQGLFLCAYLKKIPLLEDENGSKIVKKPDSKDRAYVYLGLRKAAVPSVAVYLPKSMSVDLGPRIAVKDFWLELSVSTTKGPRAAFFGKITLRFDEKDKRDPINFELGISGDATGGALSMVTDAVIDNPFGLSKRITLGAKDAVSKLGIQLDVVWAQLAASGLPSGFGLSGTLVIDKGTAAERLYGMTVNLSDNPTNFILIIDAPNPSFNHLVELANALSPVPTVVVEPPNITFRNISVYASLGGSFGSEVYPPGFRLKGVMGINGTETFFTCSLDLSGIKIVACIPSFEVGPLKVTGTSPRLALDDWSKAMTEQEQRASKTNGTSATEAVNTAAVAPDNSKYAIFKLIANVQQQEYMLKGNVIIFDIVTEADIHCQYKPTQVFKIDFKLQWNELLLLDLHSETTDLKDIQNPGLADFEIRAVFSQAIIAQVTQTATEVLQGARTAVDDGLKEARIQVEAANAEGQAKLEMAKAALEILQKEFDAEENGLNQQIAANSAKAKTRELQLKKEAADAAARAAAQEKEAREREAADLAKAQAAKTQRELQEKQRLQRLEAERNSRKREAETRQSAMTAFGNCTEDNLRSLKHELVEQAKRAIPGLKQNDNDLSWWSDGFEKGNVRAQIELYEAIIRNPDTASDHLRKLRDVANSSEYKQAASTYKQAQSAFDDAQRALDSGKAEYERQISDALVKATQAVDAARRDVDDTIASAKRRLEEANKAVENLVQEQGQELDDLHAELQKLGLSALKTRVGAARVLVEQLKNDKTASITVSTGLDLLGKLSNEQLDTLDAKLKAFTSTLVTDIRLELRGEIKAKAEKVEPFLITVKGKFGGTQDFSFELEWRPWGRGLDESSWFKRLGRALLGVVRGDEGLVAGARGLARKG